MVPENLHDKLHAATYKRTHVKMDVILEPEISHYNSFRQLNFIIFIIYEGAEVNISQPNPFSQ